MMRKIQLATLLLIVASISCGLESGTTAKDATLEAISSSIRGTATYQAAQNQNPNVGVETAEAAATLSGESGAATQAAEAALSDEAKAATATAVAPILAELPKYGVDPNAGQMGWIHPPAALDTHGYMQYAYVNRFIATVAQDFVVSSDITWNSQYSTNGCGFVLRSDGNKNALNQYIAVLTREAIGHFLFGFMVKGKVITGRDIYAFGRDPNFNWENNKTNRLTIVGRGSIFQIYTNGTLIGKIDTSAPPPLPSLPDPPKKPDDLTNVTAMADYQNKLKEHDQVVKEIKANYQADQREIGNANTVFNRGLIALVVLSESGSTHCEFNNTWLWLIG
jgi:hypothetical protein